MLTISLLFYLEKQFIYINTSLIYGIDKWYQLIFQNIIWKKRVIRRHKPKDRKYEQKKKNKTTKPVWTEPHQIYAI